MENAVSVCWFKGEYLLDCHLRWRAIIGYRGRSLSAAAKHVYAWKYHESSPKYLVGNRLIDDEYEEEEEEEEETESDDIIY